MTSRPTAQPCIDFVRDMARATGRTPRVIDKRTYLETVDADLAAMSEELEQLSGKPASATGQARQDTSGKGLPRKSTAR